MVVVLVLDGDHASAGLGEAVPLGQSSGLWGWECTLSHLPILRPGPLPGGVQMLRGTVQERGCGQAWAFDGSSAIRH